MLKAIKSLFRGTVAQPGALPTDPSHPEYVPQSKAKVPGATHPLVNQVKGKARGVGIVYDKDGRPKITKDWLVNLSPEDRRAADINLAAHGWKIGPDNILERAT